MSLNIENLSVQFKETYQLFSNKVGEWAGHAITVLKSGREAAIPYFQDKYLAVVSLAVMNLFLIEIASPVSGFIDRKIAADSEGKKLLKLGLQATAITLIIGGGVVGFAQATQLPLSKSIITAISLATLSVRLAFTVERDA